LLFISFALIFTSIAFCLLPVACCLFPFARAEKARAAVCILRKIRTHFTYAVVSRNLCFLKKGPRATGA